MTTRLYVESNFVLELCLRQEQHEACEVLLARAEQGLLTMVIPAFSVGEPQATLVRRQKERRKLADDLTRELSQLSRSKDGGQIAAHRGLAAQLVAAGDKELADLKEVLLRIAKVADIVPLDYQAVSEAWETSDQYGLELPDAIVLASVLSDLRTKKPDSAFFPNRNTKDFEDPEIIEILADLKCTLLPGFDVAVHKLK